MPTLPTKTVLTTSDPLAFVTGSNAYGVPTEASDIDLVVRCDQTTEDKIRIMLGLKDEEPVRFGKLNLILCTSDEKFAVWRIGTTKMMNSSCRPFNKVQAKAVLDELRLMVGLKDESESAKEN